jgi:excisionase family DNA binding protein
MNASESTRVLRETSLAEAIEVVSASRTAAWSRRNRGEAPVSVNQEFSPTKLLLTVTEASEVLAISRSKLYELLNSGLLPSVHIGRSRRIRMKDVEDFVYDGGHEY